MEIIAKYVRVSNVLPWGSIICLSTISAYNKKIYSIYIYIYIYTTFLMNIRDNIKISFLRIYYGKRYTAADLMK